MSKTRATTIQQRFGFKDDDLKTPTHDQLMLWLDENAEEVINKTISNEWTEDDIREANQELGNDETNELIELARLPEKTPLEIIKKTWESPIMSGNYVVGFIDMRIKYKADCVNLNWRNSMRANGWYIEKSPLSFPICIEVKSSIPSLGELIRQVRMYQKYLVGHYAIVSPDARFAEAIRSQDIGFYHCILDPFDTAMT